MKMKLFLLGIFLITCAITWAQDQDHKKAPSFPSEEMITSLKLSEAQVSALSKADTEFKAALKTLRAKEDLDKTQLRNEYAKLLATRLAKVKMSLDNTQYVSYLEEEMLKIQMKGYKSFERMKNAMSGGPAQRPNAPETIPDGGGGGFSE